MNAAPERGDVAVSDARWVAVVRVGERLWAVGPLPEHNATLAIVGLVEGWLDAEGVGLAELVAPGEAHDRVSQMSRASRERGDSGAACCVRCAGTGSRRHDVS